MDLSEKLHRSVKIDTWISLSSLMNLSMDLIKLLHGFRKIDTGIDTGVVKLICQSCPMYFSPFAKQNQAEV